MYQRLTKKVGDEIVCSLHSASFCNKRKCSDCYVPALLMEQLFIFEEKYTKGDDDIARSEFARPESNS